MIILKQLLDLCSPQIRKLISDFLNGLKASASNTENDWDDLLVHILFIILGFPYKP
ncbi:hypothetical protein ES705_16755 [subsurface metagenome]|jgi:hypothetical protein